MRVRAGFFAALTILLGATPALTQECADPSRGLPVSRVIEIDASSGPLYGDITKFAKEQSLLGPKEVVLTFDDGPMPWVTRSILDTLDRFCTKATFFSVGRMAVAYPASIKDVLARGHTLGTHTWSHPLNLRRLKPEKALEEIERGFSAVNMAAGEPIAPFFRFPGLSDSPGLLAHLQSRGVATFTVDVVSNDSFIGDPARLAQLTLSRLEARQGGIMLFHDIKSATAKALPTILAEMKARGYKVVHLRSKAAFKPVDTYDGEIAALLAKAQQTAQSAKSNLVPFYGTTGPQRVAQLDNVPVTQVAPEPRSRDVAEGQKSQAAAADKPRRERIARVQRASAGAPAVSGWATTVKRSRRPGVDADD